MHAYRQEQRHKIDKRRIKLEEEEKLEIKKENLAVQKQQTLQAEIEMADKEKEAAQKDPKILWEKDYEVFKQNGLDKYLVDIAESVYEHSGKIKPYYSNERKAWIGVELSKDELAVAHTNNLIEFNNGEEIMLTEKGKFFLGQRYLF